MAEETEANRDVAPQPVFHGLEVLGEEVPHLLVALKQEELESGGGDRVRLAAVRLVHEPGVQQNLASSNERVGERSRKNMKITKTFELHIVLSRETLPLANYFPATTT